MSRFPNIGRDSDDFTKNGFTYQFQDVNNNWIIDEEFMSQIWRIFFWNSKQLYLKENKYLFNKPYCVLLLPKWIKKFTQSKISTHIFELLGFIRFEKKWRTINMFCEKMKPKGREEMK